jgi:hypothetical protein
VLPHPRREFDAVVESYRRERRYWPGRYAVSLFEQRWARLTHAPTVGPEYPDPAKPDTQRLQARLFLSVLRSSQMDLTRFRIIVFELNAFNTYCGLFTPRLQEALGDPSLPEHLRRMVVLDLASELGPQHWYILDDHLRASGHRIIAERLAAVIRGAEARPPDVR